MEPQNLSSTLSAGICPVCHQATLPTYYFCPNCGTKLNQAPLSTTLATQLGIYAFSIILPMVGFILVTKWPGVKYYKSQDERAKTIGTNAWILLVLSTALTIWWAVSWTQSYIQSTVNSINTDFSGL